MTVKRAINIATLALIALILYLARHELIQAWELLLSVKLQLIVLLIPLQLLSYYAVGAMIFSYIQQKEHIKANKIDLAKMALELNFVNHILPSGGVSGASYMTWRLRHLGIGAGRATIAQVVRFAAGFAGFLFLLGLALIWITLDGSITRGTILITSLLSSSIVFGTVAILYILDSEKRLNGFVRWIVSIVNWVVRTATRGHKTSVIDEGALQKFFKEIREDYTVLKQEPRLLIRPFIWGIIFTVAEIGMFWVTFLALGSVVNPAPLLIGYGLATIAGMVLVTPGGAGGYELLMIGFLTSAGIDPGASVAAVLLTRTLLILGTIITGYFFYHQALNKYAKETINEQPDA
jgi:putative heme transporter